MLPFRLSIPTSVFRKPLRTAIGLAAAVGVDGVQFDVRREVTPEEFGASARQQLRHFLAEQNLKVGACTLTTQGTLTDPERLDARVTAIRRSLEFAHQLGAEALTVRLGALPTAEQHDARDRLLDVLNDLAAYSNRIGAQLAVSTLGNRSASLRALAAEIQAGPLGFDLDPAGCVFAGEPPHQVVAELHAQLAHVQIRDGVRLPEGEGVETAIGAGEVVWDEFLASLAEADYRGWLTVRRTGGDDLPGDIARGVQYVRNVAAG